MPTNTARRRIKPGTNRIEFVLYLTPADYEALRAAAFVRGVAMGALVWQVYQAHKDDDVVQEEVNVS